VFLQTYFLLWELVVFIIHSIAGQKKESRRNGSPKKRVGFENPHMGRVASVTL